jgi:hypothetical protein
MIRRRLPNRRVAITHDLAVGQQRFAATIGFDPLGRPREIFLGGPKSGSDVAAVLADVSVAISVALQCGVSASAMAVSIGRTGEPAQPISIVGAALAALAAYEDRQPCG